MQRRYQQLRSRTLTVVSDRPVGTSEAAKVLGVHRGTLARWWANGDVTPAYVTPGGQARWDLDDLRRQLREKPPVTDDE